MFVGSLGQQFYFLGFWKQEQNTDRKPLKGNNIRGGGGGYGKLGHKCQGARCTDPPSPNCPLYPGRMG